METQPKTKSNQNTQEQMIDETTDSIINKLLSDDIFLYHTVMEVMNGKPMNVKKIRNNILKKYSIHHFVSSTDIQRLGSKISYVLRQRDFILNTKNSKRKRKPLYIPPQNTDGNGDGYD